MLMGNKVVMDRCGIMSVEKLSSVLPVERNVHSTSKQGDPSCENSGVNAALRAALTLSDKVPHALNIIRTHVKETFYKW